MSNRSRKQGRYVDIYKDRQIGMYGQTNKHMDRHTDKPIDTLISTLSPTRDNAIIFPFMRYKVALATAGLPSMYERRETITAKIFNDVISNPDHKRHSLLPTRNQSKYSLRNNRAYHLPGAKTNRLKNTFIYNNCR